MNNQITIRINRGAIQLPQDWVAELEGQEAAITKNNDNLVVTPKISREVNRRKSDEAWKKAAGMWQNRQPDPIKELNKIRQEWDRDLP